MQHQQFFEGLHALAAAAFPKHCRACGRTFATAEEFMSLTQAIRQSMTGLKEGFDDNNIAIVEAYRNCPCGSTLMGLFLNRRDISDAGRRRRVLFNKLLPHLQAKGMGRTEARGYLLGILRGKS
ncbi:oxidoreductase [Massilia sp. BJB1822]|uniref:oxidoreductase n=1 Tax=Massilia sp. BJB1822 TaxID=2744470 RepID=UPI001592E381|nr:oxidoreductase [Massilia sp. BJB1822]NVE00683.1 oxidoreductase [Massilia sp. BJB1822]